MARTRCWRRALMLAVLAVSLQTAAGQTVTVSDRNVIAILGVEGHDFTKFCTADGISVQEFQWLLDEAVVETDAPDDGHYFISNDMMTAANEGDYYCRVKRMDDSLTNRSSAGRLTVLENEVIVAPSPQYGVLGSTVELQCSLDIDLEGVDIRDTWAVGDSSDFSTGANLLSPVEMSHEGRYTCRLNDLKDEMEEVEVPIVFRITIPPVISSTPDSLYTFTGEDFERTISLLYSGREGDTSSVTWRQNGEPLPISGTAHMIETTFSDLVATTSLIFTASYLPRSFEGEYSVEVTNDNDAIHSSNRTLSFSFTILVTVLPAAITEVNVTSLSPLSALVKWAVVYRHGDEHPDNITIFIKNQATGAISCHLVSSPVSSQSAEVEVFPGVEYSVTMESANEDGRSLTQPVTFRTDPTAPAVDEVQVSRLNSTSFTITTKLLYTGARSITHFSVSFRISGELEWSRATMVPVQLVPESDNLVWTGIVTNQEFAQYVVVEFRVQVVNKEALISIDDSPHTEPLVLPAAPVGIEAISTTMTSAVLEVQLSPVGTPPLLVVLDLTSHPELGCCGNQTTFLRGGSVRFSLEGLSADTTYTVSVFVKNHAGQGVGKQQSFSTDGDAAALPLWQTVLIGVCGAIVLVVLVVLFCVLLCCGCKASRRWGRKEYHTGPIEMAHRELDRGNPMLTRSTRSNGYAASQVSFGSNQGRPLTPRTPTGLSVTSPSFEYTDAPKYDLQTSRTGSSMSPFHASSREKLTHAASMNLYYPTYPNDFPEEVGYQSLPRGIDGGFPFGSLTLSPPPAPTPCSTDV